MEVLVVVPSIAVLAILFDQLADAGTSNIFCLKVDQVRLNATVRDWSRLVCGICTAGSYCKHRLNQWCQSVLKLVVNSDHLLEALKVLPYLCV